MRFRPVLRGDLLAGNPRIYQGIIIKPRACTRGQGIFEHGNREYLREGELMRWRIEGKGTRDNGTKGESNPVFLGDTRA